MKLFPFAALLVICISCSSKPDQNQETGETVEAHSPSLKLVWASDTVFRTPESVLYDGERGVIYVANVNLNPWEKDSNGFISKIDLQGNMLELEWITGLHGPKGMGIVGESLFVADIDELVEISISGSEIVNRYPLEGTPTLNDVTVGEGKIYVSGSDVNKVYALTDGQMEVFLEVLGGPNGLFSEPGRLLVITSNSGELKSVDLETKVITNLVDSLGHGDGIVPVGNQDYLASDWAGQLFYLTTKGECKLLLDTRESQINAADIDYVKVENLLLVPTFFDNRVMAYRLQ